MIRIMIGENTHKSPGHLRRMVSLRLRRKTSI